MAQVGSAIHRTEVPNDPTGLPITPLYGMRTPWLRFLVSAVIFSYVLSLYVAGAIPTYSRISIVLSTSLALILLVYSAKSRLLITRPQLIPLGFVVFVGMSYFWAESGNYALLDIAQTFSGVLGCIGIWVALNNGIFYRVVVLALISGGLAVIASASGEILEGGVGARASGLTGNANSLAVYLGYAAFAIWASPERMPRWVYPIGWAFVATGVLFTGSRKSLIILAAAIIWATPFFSSGKSNRRARWILLLGVTLAVAGAAFLIPAQLARVPETAESIMSYGRYLEKRDAQEPEVRMSMALEGFELWRESPLGGNGAGQFAVLSGFGVYSHNNFSELLANFGVIGFLLYYLFPMGLLASSLRGVRRREVWGRQCALLVLLAVTQGLGMVAYSSKVTWLFLAIIAFLVGRSSSRRSGMARHSLPS